MNIDNSERVPSHFVARGRWGEFLAYKALILIFVVSLGNSNATIRRILESVRH